MADGSEHAVELDAEGQVDRAEGAVGNADAGPSNAEAAGNNDVGSYDEGDGVPPPPPPAPQGSKKKWLLLAAAGLVVALALGLGLGLGLTQNNQSGDEEGALGANRGSGPGAVGAEDAPTYAPTGETPVPTWDDDYGGVPASEATTTAGTSAATTTEAATAGATTAGATEPPPTEAADQSWPEPTEIYDAIIVGAGWAGIKAAETLVDAGITNILVLEANNYVGGRSKSYNSNDGSHNNPDFVGDASNMPYDLGSEWLYNTGSDQEDALEGAGYLDALLDNPKDTAVPMEKGYAFYIERPDGTTTPLEEGGEWIDEVWGGFLDFRDNRYDLLEGLSYAGAIDQYVDRWNWDDDESQQFLNLMETAIEVELSGDSSEIDVQDLELFPPGYEMRTHYVSVPGVGFGNMAAAYARPLEEYIRLNAKVAEIDSSAGDDPTIRYEENGAKKAVRAKTVLITASVGALKAGVIDFIPALPQWKQEGIQNMGFGVVNKCSMSWNDDAARVWPEDKYWFYLITAEDETSSEWTQFLNPSQFKEKPFLTAFIGGDDARAWESKSDDEIFERVFSNLRSMFPDITEPDDYVITRWGQEDTIRGAYSHPMPGRSHSDVARVLARRVGRMYFAGEGTDTGGGWGTTMGAWNTGEDTAEEMVQRINNL
ncbi:hypothetical protein ACHAXT_005072 [Thalassiosira profunda]